METTRVEAEDLLQVARELRRDFEGTCAAIASELATCDDPSHWLDLLTVLADPQSNEAAELKQRLDEDLLPQVVQLLLGKSFDLGAVERVNAFLQWTLVTGGRSLKEGDISRLSCLARILDAHRRFYLYHGTSNDGTGWNQQEEADQHGDGAENQQPPLQFTVHDSLEYTSRYFLRNLEYWGNVDGFTVFLDVLRSGASFEVLQCILRTLYDVKDHLKPDFLTAYFPKLIDSVRTLIASLEPAEFYALSRESLLEVVQVMELLLVKIQHHVDADVLPSKERDTAKAEVANDAVDERHSDALRAGGVCEQRVQILLLEISLRFFRSISLEKRIYGLTEIVVIITRLYNDQIQEQVEPTAVSLYAVLNFLVEWMHETQLMQELLGEKMHVELIKRSTSLFQFASELECLPTEWIDLVWKCYHTDTGSASDQEECRPIQRRHEAFRSTIHDLLLEMVTFMELPSLIHLVGRIEEVKAKLDANQLSLLAAIAARRFIADETVDKVSATPNAQQPRSLRERILMHLWKVVLPSATSEDFRDEVLLRMHEMFRLEVASLDGCDNGAGTEMTSSVLRCSLVDDFLRICLDNIAQCEKVIISLKLFTQLSSLVAEVGIITPCPFTKSYVRVLLKNTVEYKEYVREALQTSRWLDMDDDERANLPMLKNHVNEVKNRLLALRAAWLLDECGGDRSFTEEKLNKVWELMVMDAFLLDEAALCFQWIELCMNTPLQRRANHSDMENVRWPRTLMPLETTEYLLTTKFSTLPGNCITLSALCCFHSIFRRINISKGSLEIFTTSVSAAGNPSMLPSPTERASSGSSDDDKEESIELMTGQPLMGLDELWQLAVNATDSAVAEEIITLLASFHLGFAPSVRETEIPLQYKMRFLDRCMEFITTAKADAEIHRKHLLSPACNVSDQTISNKLAVDVAIVNRCVDLLRYFLEASQVGDESPAKEVEVMILQKLEREEISLITGDGTRKKAFRLEHLEDRLPYLEIYPSPMKDHHFDPEVAAKLGYRTGRRPSWTFRQQHALLDVITDANEETEVEDTGVTDSVACRNDEDRKASSAVCRSETKLSSLKVDNLMTGSPVKPSMRSPCVRANLRWPQAPSPQRGPDLRPEDIDHALTDFTSGSNHESNTKSVQNSLLPPENAQGKPRLRYGVMSQILANQGVHFDILMELVDWDEGTSQRTWDLLCRLPTNNELLRKMIRLRSVENDSGEVKWSDLLSGSNIHRLLYALRLVEALLIPVEAPTNDDQDFNSGRRQWRERFVRLGGTQHLYDTLLKWPVESPSHMPGKEDSLSNLYARNIQATCLAAVIRVLDYFLHWSRLSFSEKIQLERTSPFDHRLQSSTLPAFIKSLDLPSMLQVVVQLTERFCSRESKAQFSDELAEAVYCGVQMSCSLIRLAPHLTTIVFAPDSSRNNLSSGIVDGRFSRVTLSNWLGSLLVDCSSKATRAQVLGALSDMASDFGAMDAGSPARALFDPLVVSACFVVSEESVSAACNYSGLEELFTFCKVLLGCCGRVRAYKAAGLEPTSEVNDNLAAALINKNIPDRLLRNLQQIVSQRQASTTATRIRATRNHEEGIMGGYLQLLILLASISEKIRVAIMRYKLASLSSCSFRLTDESRQIISFVLRDLLLGGEFTELENSNPPVCKAKPTRELAQRFLLSLVVPQLPKKADGCKATTASNSIGLNDDVLFMLSQLQNYQARVLQTVNLAGRQWNYAPAESFLDPTKSIHHAGLVNPGCICYMNSLVQQLFMMPSFCGGLLALDCSKIADQSSPWKEEVEQLQRLFVSLAFTNYRSSDPTTFAQSHKDMDGNSTDMHIQMDADEFFCLLLDRLEMFIRPKAATQDGEKSASTADGNKDFMARCFGGVLVNQILTEQGNLSEREEKFFALSLEVSKKRHLAESLGLYVQGETLEGENAYFCERVQRKVSATKRVCIKTLPQTLVCHLKRFEFDYDTMEKVKINDYLEFPTELDMFPYTSEALTTSTTGSLGQDAVTKMYDLVGVVVHSGTSDTGHYYSFIKDRHNAENQRWLEFNDEVVREFDVELMGEECYGGEEVAQKWDAIQGTYSPIVQMKRRSAYMLIYEMRSTKELASPVASGPGTLTLSNQVQILATHIMQENARYEGVVNAFDLIYDQFICGLIERVARMSATCDPAVIRQVYQLGCEFMFGIRSLRSKNSAPSTPSPTPAHSSSLPMILHHSTISTHVTLWLSGYRKNAGTDVDERVQFSKWILTETVALPTAKINPTANVLSTVFPQVECQRTWLFDVLFLSAENPELANSCFQVLLAAVSVLARDAAANSVDAEKSLVAFFRESLNLFYSKEPHLDVCDPASGCVLTLSIDTRVAVMRQLCAFFETCVSESIGDVTTDCQKKVVTELCTIRRLFLDKLQFLNHFLLTLQTPYEASDISTSPASNPLPARGISSLAIETRSPTPLRDHDLRLCTFHLETKLLKSLLRTYNQYDQRVTPPLDTTLLLNHTALKNVILFELEEVILPLLTSSIFEIEASSSKCDRLVALLIGILEEVKDTHADRVLAAFGELLDNEEERLRSTKSTEDVSSWVWTVHRHVFSPSRGILESVAYYRDHGSHEYTLLLLQFIVHRASRSSMLQELFRSDTNFRDQVQWIPNWLADHLDCNGKIRAMMNARGIDDHAAEDCNMVSEKVQGVQEVQEIFIEVEKAFGAAVPAYCDDVAGGADLCQDGHLQTDPHSSPSALTTEDVVLEALDLERENQHDVSTKFNSVKRGADSGRCLGQLTGEIGPEHEGIEADARDAPKPDWKLHRSREELSMLLRIDLDIAHNNAREA
ncbi:unnamed protein product [Phytophthora lilii]|uniref:ubiquitinyl hydrolase 1 n=1 Tax=Phytophthora lilii TaxID=2077276 RepID=A0A9W6THD0_9STRA|nr:unnamed protein product [Phytophthora lilii]